VLFVVVCIKAASYRLNFYFYFILSNTKVEGSKKVEKNTQPTIPLGILQWKEMTCWLNKFSILKIDAVLKFFFLVRNSLLYQKIYQQDI
jgi:hypothetical protein